MAFRFAAVTYKEISQIIKQAVPEIHESKKVTKSGLEVLKGKALSVWLEFIDESGEKVFVYKWKLSLALLYLADMVINKFKLN